MSGSRVSAAVILAATCGIAVASNSRADWPQYTGPMGNFHATDTGLLKKWPEGGPRLLAGIADLGGTYSSVAVVSNRVYTLGHLSKPPDKTKTEQVSCYDLITFKKLWQSDNGPSMVKVNWGGARTTPAVSDGMVFVLSMCGRLGAFDAGTGKEVWGANILERFNGKMGDNAISESVTVAGDKVICAPGGPDAAIVALNKRTGATIWTSKGCSNLPAHSSGIVFEFGGVRQFVNILKQGMVSVRLSDGKVLWQTEIPFGKMCSPAPLFADGFVVGAHAYCNRARAVQLKADGEGTSCSVAWDATTLYTHYQTYVAVGGYIYGYSSSRGKGYNWHNQESTNGYVCLDLKTGTRTYCETNLVQGSTIYADGMLYYWDIKGGVKLIEPDPKQLRIISSFTVPKPGNEYFAHPVIADGKLFLRTHNILYVYDIRQQ